MHLSQTTQSHSPAFTATFNALFERFGASLCFDEAAPHLGYKNVTGAYQARRRGTFPVQVRQAGSKLLVSTADLAGFLTGEAAPLRATAKARTKTGRPTKIEEQSAARLGLTVRQLRQQAAVGAGEVSHV